MHKLNLAPCVPPELFEYMDSVSDKVNKPQRKSKK